jgi:hypothetical protein
MKPRIRSLTKARKSHKNSCKSCKLLHGKHGIVCGVHPYGPVLSDCPDHEPVSRWVYVWRVSENVRLFLHGASLIEIGLISILGILISPWMAFEIVFHQQVSPSEFIQVVLNIANTLGSLAFFCSVVLFAITIFVSLSQRTLNDSKAIVFSLSFTLASLLWLLLIQFIPAH